MLVTLYFDTHLTVFVKTLGHKTSMCDVADDLYKWSDVENIITWTTHRRQKGSCPVYTMWSQRKIPLSLNLKARWKKVISATLWPLYLSWGEPSYIVKWSWGLHMLSRCVCRWKNLFWPGFKLRLIRPTPSHYPAPFSYSQKTKLYSKTWASSSLTG